MCPYDGGHLSPRGSLVTPEALTHKLFMHLPLPPGAPVALSSRGPQCTGRCSVDMNHQVSKCGLNRAMGGVRGACPTESASGSQPLGRWEKQPRESSCSRPCCGTGRQPLPTTFSPAPEAELSQVRALGLKPVRLRAKPSPTDTRPGPAHPASQLPDSGPRLPLGLDFPS